MDKRNYIGDEVDRIDGVIKVTGNAKYVNDYNFPGLLHARILTSHLPMQRLYQ